MTLNLQLSDFDFITCSMTRQCMENGCWAIDQTNLWEWLRSYEVNPSEGFMFSNAPEITILGSMMDSPDAPTQVGHSGASFGITMRNLHYIAKNGFNSYKNRYLSYKENIESRKRQCTGVNE